MSADGVEEGLEQGLVRRKRDRSICHIDTESWDREALVAVNRGGEDREAMPPVPFHSKEATADQANDKGRVGVDMKGLVWPGLDCHNGSTEFSDVVRQTGAYEVEDRRGATWGEPGGTSGAVG